MSVAFTSDELGCFNHDYDGWMTTLSEASARLDALETAVSEIRYLCESGRVDPKQILKALDRHSV